MLSLIDVVVATKSAMEWFHYNGMKLNFSKCNLVVCGHKYKSMILKIDYTIVIETNLVKLLGIHIESELTFNKHMEIVCKKVSQKLNALLDYVPLSHFINESC